VEVGRREIAALGVSAAYAITDEVPAADALAHPDEHLRALAARVARNWSRPM
jgi:hypothetical protein